ncbi:holo-ACP synthase [Clostridium sp.]|uniref:holo-ACP synthase n=1 Tax=Clostridium sp. TaxID=1506 RepID=UPI002FCB67FC
MIIGVGVDIIEIRRIKAALEKSNAFLQKVFTSSEIEYLKGRNLRPEYVAGRFAAKEAVSKALGTGFRGFEFKDIIIESTTLGKPIVVLKGKAKLIAKKEGEYNIHLSISHGEDNAIAYAVLEVNPNGKSLGYTEE